MTIFHSQVSKADNYIQAKSVGLVLDLNNVRHIFQKEVGTLFVGLHKTGPCEAAELAELE